MEGIKIYKRPKLKKPYFIVGWPGMGNVAFKAASYLVEKLKAEEFAELLPEDFFYLSASVIKSGMLEVPQLPQGKFYFWKNPGGRASNDLIIFISNAQPDLMKAEEYSKRILYLASSFKAEMVVSFASMPQPIDHTQEPGIWFASTSAQVNSPLKKFNFNLLSDGQISGMNGLFLGIAKREGFKGFCLFGEIPLYAIQIDNPKASCAVLAALTKILNIRIDFTQLIEQSNIMEDEINKLMDYLKLGPAAGQPGPIGEEEIEKIRNALGQLTKLPGSVKEKIEKLFEQTKTDLTKAGGLKAELDKWNVYKDYEDRFLDLFRGRENKGN